jgi:hypothetical protein|tara:strand:+ start:94 stop:330 length:237 start_codon:yes stop_codon:yes gene_type:complete
MKKYLIFLVLFGCSFAEASDKGEAKKLPEEKYVYTYKYEDNVSLRIRLAQAELELSLIKIELQAIREVLEQLFFKKFQ